MTEKLQVYKCEICGNIVEVLHAGAGELVCCGQPMKRMEENTTDAAREKHVPVVEISGEETIVKVGSVAHPMTEEHYIEWIQLISPDGKHSPRHFMKLGEAPETVFKIKMEGATARAYCNLHGLWTAG
ncbi:MAG: desulfoferrodoxin [Candidatus Euphemobacter frigidus]|nr:desulfoferrodoxin [Candidatus Euphemobacter frigidus]MDP8276652.1 desulfoferrodoxin [Candidatus Euphemobacter frigidus]